MTIWTVCDPSPSINAFSVASGRSVRFAIDPLGPEVTLEGGDRLPGLAVVDAGDLHAVAVKRQHRLHRPHRRTFLLVGEQRRAGDRRGLGPMADAAPATACPTGRLRPDRACAPARCRNGRGRARARSPSARRYRARARSSPRSAALGKGGEPPSWPGLTISIPIEAEFRSVSPFHEPLPACQARSRLPRPVGRSAPSSQTR